MNYDPYTVRREDYDRWSGQVKSLFHVLEDGQRHRREEMVGCTKSKNITAVVSALRHKGAVIECTIGRGTNEIYYQLHAMTDSSTVQKGIHCNTCRCSGD